MASHNPFVDTQGSPVVVSPQAEVRNTQWTRARGLKFALVAEMILSLWMLVLGNNMLPILIVLPTNLIGFFGAHLLRKNLLTICIFMKSLILGLVSYYLISLSLTWATCYNCGSAGAELPTITCIFVLAIFYQILCIIVAARIRNALIVAESRPTSNVELGRVSETPVQPAQNAPVYPYPAYPAFPMPYMQNGAPQGYPVPYVYQPDPANGQPVPVPVYPAYMYPQETPYTEAALPSESDQASLLQDTKQ